MIIWNNSLIFAAEHWTRARTLETDEDATVMSFFEKLINKVMTKSPGRLDVLLGLQHLFRRQNCECECGNTREKDEWKSEIEPQEHLGQTFSQYSLSSHRPSSASKQAVVL